MVPVTFCSDLSSASYKACPASTAILLFASKLYIHAAPHARVLASGPSEARQQDRTVSSHISADMPGRLLPQNPADPSSNRSTHPSNRPGRRRSFRRSYRFTASWFPSWRSQPVGFVSERELRHLASLHDFEALISNVHLMVDPPIRESARLAALAVAYVRGEYQVDRAYRQHMLWKIVYGIGNPEVAVQLPDWTTYPSRPPPMNEQILAANHSRESTPVSADSPRRWISPPSAWSVGADGRNIKIPVCEVPGETAVNLSLRMNLALKLMVGRDIASVLSDSQSLLQEPLYQ